MNKTPPENLRKLKNVRKSYQTNKTARQGGAAITRGVAKKKIVISGISTRRHASLQPFVCGLHMPLLDLCVGFMRHS